jgi:hypothetical protein
VKRPSKTLLAIASAPALAAGILVPSRAGAAVLPPADPPDTQPTPSMLAQCSSPASGPSCDAAVLPAIDYARSLEGVGPMVLPANYESLPGPEQLLTVINLERVDRGLPPVAGLSDALDSDALAGADHGGDPPVPPAALASGIWMGGYGTALYDDFYWMYDDGPGGINVSSPWSHRNAILAAYPGPSGEVLMGAAIVPAAGYPDSAAVVIASGQAPASFTWDEEVPYLSYNLQSGPTDLGALPGGSTTTWVRVEPSGQAATFLASLSGSSSFSLENSSCSAGPAQWCTIVVAFSPRSPGAQWATLTVAGPGGARSLSLAGGPYDGYWLAGSDGGIFTYGTASFFGSMGGIPLVRPVVGVASTNDRNGYWEFAADGGVFSFGDAPFLGCMAGQPTDGSVVGGASDPAGTGYWEVTSAGAVYPFGDAGRYGSMAGQPLSAPIVGMAPTPDGGGYYLVGADGQVYTYGDAHWYGSATNLRLAAPVVGIVPTVDGGGYWLVARDGGVFTYGDAPFLGSAVPLTNAPVVGMVRDLDGGGYWVDASNGAVFTFGDAHFDGAATMIPPAAPIVGATG